MASNSYDPQNELKRTRRVLRIMKWVSLSSIALISLIIYLISSLPQNKPGMEAAVAVPDLGVNIDRSVSKIVKWSNSTTTIDLSLYNGKVVLLTFWAHWCKPCLTELPEMFEMYEKFKDEGLVIIPINVDSDQQLIEKARRFWEQGQFPVRTRWDNSGKIKSEMKVDRLPYHFLFDKNGRVASRFFGAKKWTAQPVQKIIVELLQEKVVESGSEPQ